jgi:hypothetical protein
MASLTGAGAAKKAFLSGTDTTRIESWGFSDLSLSAVAKARETSEPEATRQRSGAPELLLTT